MQLHNQNFYTYLSGVAGEHEEAEDVVEQTEADEGGTEEDEEVEAVLAGAKLEDTVVEVVVDKAVEEDVLGGDCARSEDRATIAAAAEFRRCSWSSMLLASDEIEDREVVRMWLLGAGRGE